MTYSDESKVESTTQESQSKDDQIVEELDFNKPDYVFTPAQRHEWRQYGPYLRCMSCELEHDVYIGVERLLIGFDTDGQPIVKKRAELGIA